jgi:hypothetical protein
LVVTWHALELEEFTFATTLHRARIGQLDELTSALHDPLRVFLALLAESGQ